MKIGIDLRMYRSSVAGIGRYSQNLVENLLRIDRDDQFVFFMRPDDIKEVNSKSEIRNPKHKVVEVDIPHYSISEQTKLPKIIEKEKVDLMFFTNTNYPVRYRGKFIVAIHDLTLYFFPQTARKNGFVRRKAFNFVLKSAVKKSLKIITDSENTKKDIMDVFKTSSDKIAVIPLAADDPTSLKLRGASKNLDATVGEIKQKYAIGDSPVILYVGQFRAHKNIPNLVRTFNIVREKIPAKLVLIGKLDPNYTELIETIDKSPRKRDIVMPGFVSDEDLSAWYKLSTCYAFPSLYEGFGLPALEAMQAGLPVVTSDRSSLPEVCQEAALYFDPENTDDMANKIKKVLQNQDIRNDLIEKGKIQTAKFSWRKTAEEALKIFKSVAQ